MTVNTATSTATYTGNGVTAIFPVPFYFLVDTDLKLTYKTAATGVVRTLVLNSDYTLTGAGNGAGGSATLIPAPASVDTLYIARNVDAVQQTAYPVNSPFPAASHEKALDRLTMLVQQILAKLSFGLFRDPLGNTYDLGGSTLSNVANAIKAQDVPSLAQVQVLATSVSAGIIPSLVATYSTLASSAGSALIGFLQLGAGAVARTVQSKAQEHVSPQDYGVTADGVTDDTSALSLAISKGREMTLPRGDYLVTSIANTLGVEMHGDGRLLKSITGGFQQINTKADEGQHVFGREYLWKWLNKLRTTRAASVICSGDSTTEGGGLAPPYLFHQYVGYGGFGRGFKVASVNAGHSSKHTGDWVSTYLTADLAAAPDLYIVRWGINDPFYGRSITDFTTSLRAGLAQCRASYNVSQMSILLCVPNTTGDTPNGRDEKWYEQIRKVIRQAARDYQCCCVDLYSIFKDPRGGANLWLDDSFGDGRGIHPKEELAIQIGSIVNDAIYPSEALPRIADNANYTRSATDLPSAYPFGWSIYGGPINTVSWPVYNASIVTFRSLNGNIIQYCYSTNSATVGTAASNGGYNLPQVAVRCGTTNSSGTIDAWHPWTSDLPQTLTLANSWVAFNATSAPSAQKVNNIVTLGGMVKSGTLTALTTITTLPVGYRPLHTTCIFAVAAGPTTGTAVCQLQVLSTGEVQILAGANATYTSLNGISFIAGN